MIKKVKIFRVRVPLSINLERKSDQPDTYPPAPLSRAMHGNVTATEVHVC
jgi:hypothetical protein